MAQGLRISELPPITDGMRGAVERNAQLPLAIGSADNARVSAVMLKEFMNQLIEEARRGPFDHKLEGNCFRLPQRTGTYTALVRHPRFFHDFLLSFDIKFNQTSQLIISSFRATGMNPAAEYLHFSQDALLKFLRYANGSLCLYFRDGFATLFTNPDYGIESCQYPGEAGLAQTYTWVKFDANNNDVSNTSESNAATGVGTMEMPSSQFYQEVGTKFLIYGCGKVKFINGYDFIMGESVRFSLKEWSTFHMQTAVEFRMRYGCNFLMDTYCGFRMELGGNINVGNYSEVKAQRGGLIEAVDYGQLQVADKAHIKASNLSGIDVTNLSHLVINNHSSLNIKNSSHLNVGNTDNNIQPSGLDVIDNSDAFIGRSYGNTFAPSNSERKLWVIDSSFLMMCASGLFTQTNAPAGDRILAVLDGAKVIVRDAAKLEMHWDTEAKAIGDSLFIKRPSAPPFYNGSFVPFHTKYMLSGGIDITNMQYPNINEIPDKDIFIGTEYKFLNGSDSDITIAYNAYMGVNGTYIQATKSIPPHKYAKLMLTSYSDPAYQHGDPSLRFIFAEEA